MFGGSGFMAPNVCLERVLEMTVCLENKPKRNVKVTLCKGRRVQGHSLGITQPFLHTFSNLVLISMHVFVG